MATGNNNRANLDNQQSRHKSTSHPKLTGEDQKTNNPEPEQPAHEYYPEFDNTNYRSSKDIRSGKDESR